MNLAGKFSDYWVLIVAVVLPTLLVIVLVALFLLLDPPAIF